MSALVGAVRMMAMNTEIAECLTIVLGRVSKYAFWEVCEEHLEENTHSATGLYPNEKDSFGPTPAYQEAQLVGSPSRTSCV